MFDNIKSVGDGGATCVELRVNDGSGVSLTYDVVFASDVDHDGRNEVYWASVYTCHLKGRPVPNISTCSWK